MPPASENDAEYGVFAMTTAAGLPLIEKALIVSIEIEAVAIWPVAVSSPWITADEAPGAFGDPKIVPVEELIESPAGSAPDWIENTTAPTLL